MNTLIVYTTKYGATAENAAKLKKLLHGGVVLADLKKEKAPELSKFDRVIVGGPAYVGRVGKEILAFCNTNMQALLSKQIGLFICNIQKDGLAELEAAFPKELTSAAKAKAAFGGRLEFDRLTLPDRLVTKMIGKMDKTMPAMSKGVVYSTISDEAISIFIKEMERSE